MSNVITLVTPLTKHGVPTEMDPDCSECNYDRHRCPGCGEDLYHGNRCCPQCEQEIRRKQR